MRLYTQEEFDNAKSRDELRLKCECCDAQYSMLKHRIQDAVSDGAALKYCGVKCVGIAKRKELEVSCVKCGKMFVKKLSQIAVTKNNFCSHSCAAIYNNAHKTKGTRRSKAEAWIEAELTKLYPKLEIHFNRKDAINSELDIHIPSLNLAIELNGIFHYEPIYGEEKLKQIQNNDERKLQACIERNIEFCIIDISGIKYFKPERVKKYLDIICSVINKKLGSGKGI